MKTVVKTLHFHCRWHGIPSLVRETKVPHALWQGPKKNEDNINDNIKEKHSVNNNVWKTYYLSLEKSECSLLSIFQIKSYCLIME